MHDPYILCWDIRKTVEIAYKPLAKFFPALNGKLIRMALRVSTRDVSVADLTMRLEKKAAYEHVKAATKEESEGKLKCILGFIHKDVSTHFVFYSRSSISDAKV